MLFRVDSSLSQPIYDQISRQVKFAVADGGLRVGELVPSVRELARELTINPNTVARAYRDLQSEGILEPVRGLGLAVAEGAPAPCRRQRRELIRARLREVLEEAATSRLAEEELRELVLGELERLRSSPAERRRRE